MSAFVVSTDCMDRCVRAICGKGQDGPILRIFAYQPVYEPDAPTAIGSALFAMNINAVQQRYPDTVANPANMPGWAGCAAMPDLYRYPHRINLPMQRKDWVISLKALQCLQYQCSEGNVPDTDLFREMEAAIGTVACHIVSMLPEYDAAPWG